MLLELLPWSRATPMHKCLQKQISFTYIFRSLMPGGVLVNCKSGMLSKDVMSVKWCWLMSAQVTQDLCISLHFLACFTSNSDSIYY